MTAASCARGRVGSGCSPRCHTGRCCVQCLRRRRAGVSPSVQWGWLRCGGDVQPPRRRPYRRDAPRRDALALRRGHRNNRLDERGSRRPCPCRGGRGSGPGVHGTDRRARLPRPAVGVSLLWAPSISMSLPCCGTPQPEFAQWGWLSLLAGMAVSSAVGDLAGGAAEVSLKWPNDVLIRGRKVCGILSERIEQPDGARAVVGIGINADLTEDQLPVPTATSLALEEAADGPRAEIVAAVLTSSSDRLYRSWGSCAATWRAEYEACCAFPSGACHGDARRRASRLRNGPRRRRVGAASGHHRHRHRDVRRR